MSCNSKLFLQTWVFETTISKFFSSLESVYESYIQQSRWEKDKKRGKRKGVGDETKLFLSFCSGGGGRWEWNVSFSLDPTKRKPKRNLPLPPAWLAFLRGEEGDPNLPFFVREIACLASDFFWGFRRCPLKDAEFCFFASVSCWEGN